MKRLAILLLALSASVANAATPTLRVHPPQMTDATNDRVYRFGEPGWSVGGFAHTIEWPGFLGSQQAVLVLEIADDIWSAASRTIPSPEYGKPYAMSAWVDAEFADPRQALRLSVYAPPFSFGGLLLPSDIGPGWQHVNLGVFVDTDPQPECTLSAGSFTTESDYFWGAWLVGQIEFREVELATPTGDFGSE
jgi:hypothetical protein